MSISNINPYDRFPNPSCYPRSPSNNSEGYNELTKLMIIDNNPNKALAIMDQFKSPNMPDGNGNSLMHATISLAPRFPNECFKIMKKLLAADENINCLDSYGNTPLHNLCIAISDETRQSFLLGKNWIDHMIKFGANSLLINSFGQTPVDHIFQNFELSIETKIFFAKALLSITPKNEACALVRQGIEGYFINEELLSPSLKEIEVILNTYGDIIDLNNIDGTGTSVFTYIFYSYASDNIAYLCEVIALAVSKGADPNHKNSEGNSVLLNGIDREVLIYHYDPSNSYNRLQLLFKTLIDLGADPLKSIDNKQKGCINKIYSYFTEQFTTEQMQSLFLTLYKRDVYIELETRILLLNSYSIDSHVSTLYGETFNLEGANSIEKFIHPHIYYLNQYYKELIQELDGGEQNNFREILNRCNHPYLHKDSTYTLKKIFAQVPKILEECGTTQQLTSRELIQKIKNNAPFTMLATHLVTSERLEDEAHTVGYYFVDNIMMLGNCGAFSGNYPGLSIHEKTVKAKQFTKKLIDEHNLSSFLRIYFPGRVDLRGPRKRKTIKYIPQHHQTIGNCPIKSFNSLELGVLYYELQKYFDDEFAINLAKAIKAVGHTYRKKEILRLYLDMHHTSIKGKFPPADDELLLQIRNSLANNEDLDNTRINSINKWFKEKGLERYLDKVNTEIPAISTPSTPLNFGTLADNNNDYNIKFSSSSNDIEMYDTDEFLPPDTPLSFETADTDTFMFDSNSILETPATPILELPATPKHETASGFPTPDIY
ncbi:MAG: hypothetical protein VX777_01595 [Chlamydiota bacterium]|nr:hypothetical protein [Chlamydiota bacterium]